MRNLASWQNTRYLGEPAKLDDLAKILAKPDEVKK
jgi:hypothetical protein